jgi:hypothetical protein
VQRTTSHCVCPGRAFDVTSDDIVRLVATLDRDFDCVPVVPGILTADYWTGFVLRSVKPAVRIAEGGRTAPGAIEAPITDATRGAA